MLVFGEWTSPRSSTLLQDDLILFKRYLTNAKAIRYTYLEMFEDFTGIDPSTVDVPQPSPPSITGPTTNIIIAPRKPRGLSGKEALRKILDQTSKVNGLTRYYKRGSFSSIANADAASSSRSENCEALHIEFNRRRDNFAVEFVGYIRVLKRGTHDFYIKSDGAAKMWIDGQLVVDNSGNHGVQERGGRKYLNPGFQKIKLVYFQKKELDVFVL